MLAYARGLALGAWLFSTLFQFWWVTDWYTQQQMFEQGVNMKQYFYIGFAVMLAAQLMAGPSRWLAAPFQMISTWVGALTTAFFLLMCVLSPISRVPMTSLLYAAATWLVTVMLWIYWENNYRVLERSLVLTGWVQFAWWLVLLASLGLTGGFGGIIGDVNRNITGTAAIAAMTCALFSKSRAFRWAAFGAAAFFIVIVSSRGSMVAMTVFVAVYYTLYMGFVRATGLGALLATLAIVIVLSVPALRDAVVDKVLHINDPHRGIGSGFTGRTEQWKQGIASFWQKPVFGYGFRATTHAGEGLGGHSAYIKIFVESGFVGGFCIIGAVVVEAFRRFFVSLRLRKLRPQDRPYIDLESSLRLNVLACATMFMTLTMWVYDQYYINLGSPVSVVLFLMLMAPTYVTTQGALLRR
jgi:O-antigen ligase